jgi:hypothetical protein
MSNKISDAELGKAFSDLKKSKKPLGYKAPTGTLAESVNKATAKRAASKTVEPKSISALPAPVAPSRPTVATAADLTQEGLTQEEFNQLLLEPLPDELPSSPASVATAKEKLSYSDMLRNPKTQLEDVAPDAMERRMAAAELADGGDELDMLTKRDAGIDAMEEAARKDAYPLGGLEEGADDSLAARRAAGEAADDVIPDSTVAKVADKVDDAPKSFLNKLKGFGPALGWGLLAVQVLSMVNQASAKSKEERSKRVMSALEGYSEGGSGDLRLAERVTRSGARGAELGQLAGAMQSVRDVDDNFLRELLGPEDAVLEAISKVSRPGPVESAMGMF